MAPDRFTYPRGSRLTGRKDLQVVLRNGKRVQSELLELRGLASHSRVAQVGLIVPRYRQTAVTRNKLKRRLREIIRLTVLPSLPPTAIVIRTRPAAYLASMDELREVLMRMTKELAAKLC